MIPSGATVLFVLEVSRFRPFRRAHPFSYCPSCHRAARHMFSCSPPTGPPSSSSSPLPPFVQYFSFPLTPQRIRRTPSGPAVHLSSLSAARQGVSGPRVVQPFIFPSLSAAKKAYPDREWSRRSSSLAIRCRKGVSGPRLVQPFIFTRYPPPGRRIRTATGPGVYRHSLSAARKAHPDPEWSSRSSSLGICRQEGVSGHRAVQAFILTRYLPPGRRIGTPSGPAVHFHSRSAARKAYPDPEWSSRSSSLAARCKEGVSGPRMVQPFIFTRYPPPGRRIRTPSGPGVYLHSLSAARKAYPDPEWSSRSSSPAIRCQEGVSRPRAVQAFMLTRYPLPGPRVVQPFIFTRCPLPGRRIRTPDGPAVHLHSLSAARKAYPDPEWSRRLSSLAIRRQEGVSGPRVVQPFLFTRYPLPGRRVQTASGPGVYVNSLPAARTPSGPAVHLHSLSAARKAYPDRDWSRCLSSLALRRQKGAPRPRVVQPFIFTRYLPPGRRIRTPSGPAVHPHSLSTSRKAYRDPEWSSRSFSLAVRCQEGVSGPRVVQPFIFTRCPLPGRRIRTPDGPAVHLHSLSAARKAYPDPEWSRRLSSLAIRRQEGVSGPRVVQPFLFTRYPLPGRRVQTASGPGVYVNSLPAARTPSGPAVHLHSLSAARKAFPDRDWSRRSSSLVFPPPARRIRSRGANRSS